ncbi:outer membrane protein assembly factor BamE [Streptomyces sp. NPDC057245]|uniref:outer membrane protein assembly factor BamE n=1 Tax=Streptomyces TaxID=1883 RepID=UPI001C1E6254|nr:outer membrane protein assembly factor BamE [Streptomyces sp. A108]MBU6530503.1 hypothetical protein [Streptomyces sp. A108]
MTTVEPGMTRSQVKRLLGNPAQSITDRDYMSLYTSTSGRGFRLWRRRGRSEAWLYVGTPRTGWATWIHFSRGRVDKVTAAPLSTDPPEGSSEGTG